MKILVFEDGAASASRTEKWLIKEFNHNPTVHNTCSGVRDALHCGPFDRYIIDLNAVATGLDERQAEKSQAGLLTGWILLTEFIIKSDPDVIEKAVIFSDYVSSLKSYINSMSASEQERKWFSILENRGALISKMKGHNALRRFLVI